MNKWVKYVDAISQMKIYHLVIFVIFAGRAYSGFIYVLPILLVAMCNLFYYHRLLEKCSVVFYSIAFISLSYVTYYVQANHYFLLGIFSIYLSYKLWFEDHKWNYPFFLIAIAISVATLQKLGSTYFMNGNLLGQFLLNGSGLSLVGNILDPEFSLNSKMLYDGYGDIPYGGKQVNIVTTDTMVLFIKIFTWIVVISEVLLSFALLFLKTKWKYISLLIFLILTSITRSEFGFFTILLMISLFDTRFHHIKIRRYYKLLLPVYIICFFYVHYDRLLYFIEYKF